MFLTLLTFQQLGVYVQGISQFITYTFVVLLQKVNDSHNHNTRNNTLSFKVRYRRISKTKALSICVKGSKMRNALSADIKLSRNVNVFKKMLKVSLLENYKFLNSEQYLILKFMLNLFIIKQQI